MIRVALANSNSAERELLLKALRTCFAQVSRADVDVMAFANAMDLCRLFEERHHHFLDVIFCCVDDLATPRTAEGRRVDAVGLLADLRVRDSHLLLVIASHDAGKALDAYQLKAEFLHLPGTYDDLRRTLARPLSDISWETNPCLAVRTPGQIVNVSIADIQFVESSKRGPVIHLPKGQTVVTRGTLKSLYDKLVEAAVPTQVPRFAWPIADDAFVMAGSSFSVNLDNVVASGKGALVFADGETIIVPVRRRKDVERALDAYRRGLPAAKAED